MVDSVSPFPEWQTLREQIAPFIGDRAIALLAFAVFDEADGSDGAAGGFSRRSRDELLESGTDVDDPDVTEAEGLLLRWGRLFARDADGVPAGVQADFERTFSPELRELLVKFAALTVATATADRA